LKEYLIAQTSQNGRMKCLTTEWAEKVSCL